MGPTGKLYTYPNNVKAIKILIASEYSGVPIEIPEDFVYGKSNQTSEFLAKFPSGRVPALESGKDFVCESNAIASYVCPPEWLGGQDDMKRAHILEWMFLSESQIWPGVCNLVFPKLGLLEVSAEDTKKAKVQLFQELKTINEQLKLKTFLVGETLTLADVTLMSSLMLFFHHVWTDECSASFTHLVRWYQTIINQTKIKKVLDGINLEFQAPGRTEHKEVPLCVFPLVFAPLPVVVDLISSCFPL